MTSALNEAANEEQWLSRIFLGEGFFKTEIPLDAKFTGVRARDGVEFSTKRNISQILNEYRLLKMAQDELLKAPPESESPASTITDGEVAHLRQQLEMWKTQCLKLEETLKVQDVQAKQNEEIDNLNGTISWLQATSAQMESERNRAVFDMKEMAVTLEQRTSQRDALKSELAALRAEASSRTDAASDTAKTDATIAALEAENARLVAANQAFAQTIDDQSMTILRLQSEKNQENRETNLVIANSDDYNTHVSTIESRMKALEDWKESIEFAAPWLRKFLVP